MAQLKVVVADGVLEGHPLGDRTVLGRSREADVVLADPSVSRAHAVIARDGETWTVADQGSTAGLTVNGRAVSEATLREGDILRLGNQTCIFTLESDPPQAERRAVCESPDALVADADWVGVRDLEISMAGTRELLDAACLLLPTLLEDSCLSEQERMRFSMAGQEALGNAWRHGNKEDVSKRIVWRLIRGDHRVSLRVRDGGEGFDFRSMLSLAREGDPLQVARARYQAGKPGGLGIMMMVRGCDMVEFTRNGAESCLIKCPEAVLSSQTVYGNAPVARSRGPTVEEIAAERRAIRGE